MNGERKREKGEGEEKKEERKRKTERKKERKRKKKTRPRRKVVSKETSKFCLHTSLAGANSKGLNYQKKKKRKKNCMSFGIRAKEKKQFSS